MGVGDQMARVLPQLRAEVVVMVVRAFTEREAGKRYEILSDDQSIYVEWHGCHDDVDVIDIVVLDTPALSEVPAVFRFAFEGE